MVYRLRNLRLPRRDQIPTTGNVFLFGFSWYLSFGILKVFFLFGLLWYKASKPILYKLVVRSSLFCFCFLAVLGC